MGVPCVDEINPCGSEFAHRDCRFHYKSARRVYKTVWSSNGRHKTPVPWRVEQVSHTLGCVKQLCFINCWVRHCWYFLSISLFPQVSCHDVHLRDTQSAAFKVFLPLGVGFSLGFITQYFLGVQFSVILLQAAITFSEPVQSGAKLQVKAVGATPWWRGSSEWLWLAYGSQILTPNVVLAFTQQVSSNIHNVLRCRRFKILIHMNVWMTLPLVRVHKW